LQREVETMNETVTLSSHRPLLLVNKVISTMKFTHVIMRISTQNNSGRIQFFCANNFVLFQNTVPCEEIFHKESAESPVGVRSFLFDGKEFQKRTSNLKSIGKSGANSRKNTEESVVIKIREGNNGVVIKAASLTIPMPSILNDPPSPQIPDFSHSTEIVIDDPDAFYNYLGNLMCEIVEFNVVDKTLKIKGEGDDSPSCDVKLVSANIQNNGDTTLFYKAILKDCISVLIKPKDVFRSKKTKIKINFFKNGAARVQREIQSGTFKSDAVFILTAVRDHISPA